MRKQSELDKKSYDDLVRERDILSKVSLAVYPTLVATDRHNDKSFKSVV